MKTYITNIGVETHIQLNTASKMFCPCDNDSRSAEPNTNICPICLGFPGTLPVPNYGAIERVLKLGLAIHAQKIIGTTKFDRKNYFYPDLPKGYQISQYDEPIVAEGYVEILTGGQFKKIGIERAHLEEDAAKLIHQPGTDFSLVDFNRAGTPLVEMVSRPEMTSPAEAKRYLQEVYNLVMALGICHGDMEHGNFKFDLNVSVRPAEQKDLGSKAELKNLNSFRNAERALTYEIKRQTELLDRGEKVIQETRGWNDTKRVTFTQRIKEEASDYRYFPEPDIPPLVITGELIEKIKKQMPEVMPIEVRRQLVELGVATDDQDLLIEQPVMFKIFEEARQLLKKPELVKKAANWLVGPTQALKIPAKKLLLTGEKLADMITMIDENVISSKMANDNFAYIATTTENMSTIIKLKNLTQISDSVELEKIITKVIADNPQAKTDYQAGKSQAQAFLIGQVMKLTKGQANPGKVSALMLKLLSED